MNVRLLLVLFFCAQVYAETCNLHEVIENIYEITQEARRHPNEPEETWLPSIQRQIKRLSCPDLHTYLSLDLFADIANIVRNMTYLKWTLVLNALESFMRYMIPAIDKIVENAMVSVNAIDDALMFNFDSFDLKQLVMTVYEVIKYLAMLSPPVAVSIFVTACGFIYLPLYNAMNSLGLDFLFY